MMTENLWHKKRSQWDSLSDVRISGRGGLQQTNRVHAYHSDVWSEGIHRTLIAQSELKLRASNSVKNQNDLLIAGANKYSHAWKTVYTLNGVLIIFFRKEVVRAKWLPRKHNLVGQHWHGSWLEQPSSFLLLRPSSPCSWGARPRGA